MRTKLIIAILALVTLNGCATRTIIVQEVPIVTPTCVHYYIYSERMACERGVRQRYYEQQRKRDNEAYRHGYQR